jgi:hypothetical protein
VEKACRLVGVIDDFQILKEGEVFIRFSLSNSFKDAIVRFKLHYYKNKYF